MKKDRGCFARKNPDGSWSEPAANPQKIDGKLSFACPRQHIRENPGYWSALWQLYKPFTLGVLPDEGAIAQQSARGFKLLSLLDNYLATARAEKYDNERTNNRRNRPG